jgi:hypothetical protein
MQATKQIAVERAIKLLEAAGASYHIEVDDQEFGAPLHPEERKRRSCIINKGVTEYVRERAAGMGVGEVVVIEPGPFDLSAVQSIASAQMGTLFGQGSMITRKDNEKCHVEVLRVE